MLTDDQIAELIKCQKEIVDPPPKNLKEEKGSKRVAFTMSSTDGKYSFSGFILQNSRFPENFSVGLVYLPREEKGTITLLRCNGPHGLQQILSHHVVFHIHKATEENISKGLKAEKFAEETKEYATLDDAIQ
jgi:hypothetical protein